MVDMTGGTLGVAAIEVRAGLDQLDRDFKAAEVKTEAFVKQQEKTLARDPRIAASVKRTAELKKEIEATKERTRASLESITKSQATINALRQQAVAQTAVARTTATSNAQINRQTREFVGLSKATGTATLFMRGFVTAVGIGLAGSLVAVTINSLKATAAIKDVAIQTGLTTTELQEFRGIASQVGLTAAEMDQGFIQFHDTLGKVATSATRESKLFKLLGIELEGAGGKAKTTSELFGEFTTKMGQVGNESQRTAALALVYGETLGPKMAQLIGKGMGVIDEYRKAIHDLGLVMGEDDIQKADETWRKFDQMKLVLSTQTAGAIVDNADAIFSLANALSSLTGEIIKFLNSNPQLAMAIIGGLLGGRVGGLPGAAIGVVGGAALGMKYAQSRDDANMDPAFRKEKAVEAYRKRDYERRASEAAGGVFGMRVKGAEDEYNRQIQLYRAAKRLAAGGTAPPGTPTGPNIDLGSLFAPEPPKGRQPKQAPDNIFERESLQAQQERLRLEKDSTTDLAERNRIERELIDLKLRESIRQIEKAAGDGKLTDLQAKELTLAEEANARLEREAADREMRMAQIEQAAQVASELHQAEQSMLEVSLRLARTHGQRTEIEAALLRLKQQEELLELDKQISLAREAKDAKRIAELTELRRKLLERQGTETKAFAEEHLIGIEKFRNDLPRTVEQINEQIDKIRFDKFMERLQEAARMAEDIGQAFGRAAGNLVRDIRHPLDALKGLALDLGEIITQNFERQVSQWATQAIGGPVAKGMFGADLMNQGGLNTEQMNMALDIATANLNALSVAAASASSSMGGSGGGGGTAGAANQATAGLNALDPQLSQFGSGLMSILNMIGGGTGGGLGGLLKLGMSALGSFGGGGSTGGGSTSPFVDPSVGHWTPGSLGAGAGFAGGGWIGGTGTGRSDSNWIRASLGEHITNADAASRFGPLLDGINSGLIPDMEALSRLLGMGGGPHVPPLDTIDARDIGVRGRGLTQNFYFPGGDADSFRRSERQIRSLSRRRLGVV